MVDPVEVRSSSAEDAREAHAVYSLLPQRLEPGGSRNAASAQLLRAWGASAVDERDDEEVFAAQLVDDAPAVHGHLAHVGVIQLGDVRPMRGVAGRVEARCNISRATALALSGESFAM